MSDTQKLDQPTAPAARAATPTAAPATSRTRTLVRVVLGLALLLVLLAAAAARIGPRAWWHSLRPASWILGLLAAYHLLLRRDPAMAAEVLLTVVTALLATRVLLETTPLPELLDGLVRLLSPLRLMGADPERIGLAIQIMLRSIPFLTGVLDDLRDAAAARGTRLGPVGLAAPLVISAVAHGQRTGEALAARGLDSSSP